MRKMNKMAASSAIIRRNYPYFQQQLCAALGNSSVVVKFICIAVFLCYFLSYADNALEVLSVTPGHLVPPNFRIWSAFTYCFLETRLWHVVVDVTTVGLCGKLIEPLWGALEMLTFFAVVNLSVALITVTFYIVAYMITFDTYVLFGIHIHGLAGYIAAVTVTVKQIMPDHVLINTPLGKMRNRNIPLNVLLLAVLLWIVGLLDSTYPNMFAAGILSSWIYLRFMQYHSNGSRGDLAESFTFASFFPNVLQPVVAVVCNTIFEFLVRIKVCRKPVRKYDVGAPSSITITLPGTDPHDAERRRQIALKALSERLNKTEQAQWPLLVDEDETPPTKGGSGSSSKTVSFSKIPSPHGSTGRIIGSNSNNGQSGNSSSSIGTSAPSTSAKDGQMSN